MSNVTRAQFRSELESVHSKLDYIIDTIEPPLTAAEDFYELPPAEPSPAIDPELNPWPDRVISPVTGP